MSTIAITPEPPVVLPTSTFSALSDEYKTVMKSDISSDKFLLFKYSSPRYEGILFRGSIYQQPDNGTGITQNGGSCAIYYERGFVQAVNKIKTTGDVQLAFNLNLDKYTSTLRSRVKLSTNYLADEYKGKVEFLWGQERFNVKTTLDWSNHRCLSVKTLGLILNEPTRQLGVGAGLSLSLEDKQLSIYNTTLWYIRNSAKFVFAHKTRRNKLSLGDFLGKVYNRIDDKTDIALGFRHRFSGMKDLISFGLRYKHSEAFTVKTKINSDLNMRAVFQLLLDKNVQLTVASNYNVGEIDNAGKATHINFAPPVSLRVAFGEI